MTLTCPALAAQLMVLLPATIVNIAAAAVAAQAGELAGLVARCGGQVLADAAPSGGRHVFVVFAAALPWRELRDLCRAVALRFPAVDPAPMASLGGQVSPPGSRHKRGGWRTLTTPLSQARAAVEHPRAGRLGGAAGRVRGRVQQADRGPRRGRRQARPSSTDAGVPWVPRLGGRAPLGAELGRTARTGEWDRSRYPAWNSDSYGQGQSSAEASIGFGT